MKYVNQPVRKTDAMSLVTGKPVYTDDLAPRDCLIVKILRSPHANAWVEDIKTGTAEKVAGIACILTYKDVPQKRFTLAGQTAPEMSPDDRLILDRHVRFVGDAVAIVAGETEEAVDKALKRIRVDYRVEAPVLDIHKAKDNPILVHPEDDWKLKIPLGGDNKRNLCASAVEEHGNVDEVLAKCKYTVERTYHTRANQQTMMETFRTACYMDHFGRLIVLSSTQIPFHVRRIVGRALDIPASKVRVIKPRIGGGFGAKQTSVSEIYPAIVTWKTGRPSKMIFSRYESMICSSPRHEMEITPLYPALQKRGNHISRKHPYLIGICIDLILTIDNEIIMIHIPLIFCPHTILFPHFSQYRLRRPQSADMFHRIYHCGFPFCPQMPAQIAIRRDRVQVIGYLHFFSHICLGT